MFYEFRQNAAHMLRLMDQWAVDTLPNGMMTEGTKHLKCAIALSAGFRERDINRTIECMKEHIDIVVAKQGGSEDSRDISNKRIVFAGQGEALSYSLHKIRPSVRSVLEHGKDHYFWLSRGMPGLPRTLEGKMIDVTQEVVSHMAAVARSYDELATLLPIKRKATGLWLQQTRQDDGTVVQNIVEDVDGFTALAEMSVAALGVHRKTQYGACELG